MLRALQLGPYPPDVTRHSGDGAWRHQEVVGSSRYHGASGSGEYQLTHYRRMDSTGRPSAETANHHPARARDSSTVTPGVVGLAQVNLIVPRSVTAGIHPVMVTVGGVSSP